MILRFLAPLFSIFIIGAVFVRVDAQTFSVPLEQGQYKVGFKSYWKSEFSRTYYPSSMTASTSGQESFPRPVLINIWYPATSGKSSSNLTYGEYLIPIQGESLSLDHLALYRQYNRETFVNELFEKGEEKLDEHQKEILKRMLDTRTTAHRGAPAVKSKFPLLIYHQGNRASLDDNILLCEYLASHGYVVVNSSYLDEGGATWGVDAAMGSVRDISFILSHIGTWESNVDLQRTGVIGHSAGAQAAHIAMAQGSLSLKVMVSLETTEEYFSLSDRRWRKFLDPTIPGVEKVKGDLLFIAKPGAIFQLADMMKNATRYYYTIPGVSHNDFISQGIVRKYADLIQDTSGKSKKEFDRVSSDYVSICNLILSFANAHLKKDDRTFRELLQKESACTGLDGKCIEKMPSGNTKPSVYQSTGDKAPTIRQFRQLVAKEPDEAVAVLRKFRPDADKHGIYNVTYSFAIIDELMETGSKQTAKKLYHTYAELLGKQYVDDFKWNCDFFGMFDKEIERRCREKLEFLVKTVQ